MDIGKMLDQIVELNIHTAAEVDRIAEECGVNPVVVAETHIRAFSDVVKIAARQNHD